MKNAFYIVPISGGEHLYSSDILSDCMEKAVNLQQVEIVDMYGEVWRTTVDPRTQPTVNRYPMGRHQAFALFQRLRQGLSSTSI